MKVIFRSWFLARSLGVTKAPPEDGTSWIDVKIEGGPMLFWPIIKEQVKESAR